MANSSKKMYKWPLSKGKDAKFCHQSYANQWYPVLIRRAVALRENKTSSLKKPHTNNRGWWGCGEFVMFRWWKYKIIQLFPATTVTYGIAKWSRNYFWLHAPQYLKTWMCICILISTITLFKVGKRWKSNMVYTSIHTHTEITTEPGRGEGFCTGQGMKTLWSH